MRDKGDRGRWGREGKRKWDKESATTTGTIRVSKLTAERALLSSATRF